MSSNTEPAVAKPPFELEGCSGISYERFNNATQITSYAVMATALGAAAISPAAAVVCGAVAMGGVNLVHTAFTPFTTFPSQAARHSAYGENAFFLAIASGGCGLLASTRATFEVSDGAQSKTWVSRNGAVLNRLAPYVQGGARVGAVVAAASLVGYTAGLVREELKKAAKERTLDAAFKSI